MKKIKNNEFVKKVYDLSQNHGLTEEEIAKELNCARRTISRVRKEYDIPKRNLNNRKDKSFICFYCKKKIYIKRCESVRLMCSECESVIAKNNISHKV